MFQFIVTNVFLVSLGAILFLVARSLPRIADDSGDTKTGILDRWASSEIPEKIDATLNSFFEKFLRKMKILVMKMDNSITTHLKRVKPESNGNGKTGIDFKEMAAEKNGNGATKGEGGEGGEGSV